MKTCFSKNLLCLLLAAVLTVGTLASCAQNPAASAAESGITAAESEETAPESAPKPSEKPKSTASPKPTEKPKSTATPKPTEKPKSTAAPKPTEKPKTAQSSKTAQTAKPAQTAQAAPTTKPAHTPTPAAQSGPARCPMCDRVLNPDGSCDEAIHGYGGYAFCTYDGTTVWVTCRVCGQSWPRDTLPEAYDFTLQHGIPCYEAHNGDSLTECVCGKYISTEEGTSAVKVGGGTYYCSLECALSTGFYCPICLRSVNYPVDPADHSPDCPYYTPEPAPETPAPETPAPETPAEPAPEAPAPETPAPETPAPETPAEPAPETTPETPAG